VISEEQLTGKAKTLTAQELRRVQVDSDQTEKEAKVESSFTGPSFKVLKRG
jgi:hypothetical protein